MQNVVKYIKNKSDTDESCDIMYPIKLKFASTYVMIVLKGACMIRDNQLYRRHLFLCNPGYDLLQRSITHFMMATGASENV